MRRVVWLDVDGTSETGEPADHESLLANLSQPPLNRPYNYNYPLFDALERARSVNLSSVMLFTAYDACGARSTMTVSRCELLDWIKSAHPNIHVTGVATIVDPAFGHGPGAYYKCVIEPCERLLLSKRKAAEPDDLVKLDLDDVVETLSPLDWQTRRPMQYGDILRQEQSIVAAYIEAAGPPVGDDPFAGPRMDKERLAHYCLSTSVEPPPGVLFLDDNVHYIEQVEKACGEVGVACLSVHVKPCMQDVASFLKEIEPSVTRCAIS